MRENINIKDVCISPETDLRGAITAIDKGVCGIALVVDKKQRLLGTITDGDTRRAILAGDKMNTPVQVVLARKSTTIYPKPITLSDKTNKKAILELMKEHVIRQIPILDGTGRVVDLVTMDEFLPDEKQSMQAIVIDGGQTTRLHPLAADLPKPMLPVGNRPLMEYTINQLRKAGFDQVSLTTHYKADSVVEHFGDGKNFGVKIDYIDELNPLGTDRSRKVMKTNKTPLLVINGDVLTRVDFQAMLAYHQDHNADMTIAVHLNDFHIPFDVINTQDGYITGVEEKPTFQRFINAGAYLINPNVLDMIPAGQSFNMKEFVNQLIKDMKRIVSFPIHEYWKEIQDYSDYQQVVTDVKNGLFSDVEEAFIRMEPGAPLPQGFVPLCIPEIHGNEWVYIKECLDTNWVSSVGPFVDRFEELVANFSGNKYAVAASSGTAALHIALLVAGIKRDDEVIIPSLTFIAPANTVRYVGAYPVFIDSEPDYWQMDPEKLREFITKGCRWKDRNLVNLTTGRPVRAIIPVHVLGHPSKMDEITNLAKKYNLKVIEDATESLGAKFQDQMVGHIGDIACYSFNGNKLITTGGGGMIVTDDEVWAEKAKYLTTQAKDDPLEYVHNEVGYNYRLTNIQAALGCAQMEQVVDYIKEKQRIADVYMRAFADVPGISCMKEAPWATSVFWMYTVLVNNKKYGMDSRALLHKLGKLGIQTRPLWQPLHLSPVFASLPHRDAPVAERLNQQAISLPCSVGLSKNEQERVISAIIDHAQ